MKCFAFPKSFQNSSIQTRITQSFLIVSQYFTNQRTRMHVCMQHQSRESRKSVRVAGKNAVMLMSHIFRKFGNKINCFQCSGLTFQRRLKTRFSSGTIPSSIGFGRSIGKTIKLIGRRKISIRMRRSIVPTRITYSMLSWCRLVR